MSSTIGMRAFHCSHAHVAVILVCTRSTGCVPVDVALLHFGFGLCAVLPFGRLLILWAISGFVLLLRCASCEEEHQCSGALQIGMALPPSLFRAPVIASAISKWASFVVGSLITDMQDDSFSHTALPYGEHHDRVLRCMASHGFFWFPVNDYRIHRRLHLSKRGPNWREPVRRIRGSCQRQKALRT